MNKDGNPFLWLDAFASGPGMLVPWTSAYTTNGVMGEPQLATAEKGERCFKEAVKQLARFVTYFRDRPKDKRHDHHRRPPTMPMPWKQRPISESQ
jgi:creatinine amidohydrolase